MFNVTILRTIWHRLTARFRRQERPMPPLLPRGWRMMPIVVHDYQAQLSFLCGHCLVCERTGKYWDVRYCRRTLWQAYHESLN